MSAVLERIEHVHAPKQEAPRVPISVFEGAALFQPWAVAAMSVICLEQMRGADEEGA